jgi:hypothetical protein
VAEIGYGVSSTGSLRDEFAAIPVEYRSYFRDGFSRLAKLRRDLWPKLVSMLEEAAPYPSNIELPPIIEMLGVERAAGASIVSATRFALGAIALREDSTKDFIEAAQEAELLNAADRDVVYEFAELVSQTRPVLKKSLATGSLRHAVLPSLAIFDVAIDVRLEFADGKLSSAAPVVVAHVDTDSTEESWFQMSQAQLSALHSKLGKCLQELQQAQLIAKKML